jgi:hypothetical protein
MTAGEHAEYEVVRRLDDGLAKTYVLFRGVDWMQADSRGDRHGELDVVVVNAAGDLAILEVKAGTVDAREGVLFKRYGQDEHDVSRQTARQHAVILQRLRDDGLHVRVLHFLVLPHQRIDDVGTVAYPRERILDALDYDDLSGAIERRLGRGLASPELHERVCAFVGNVLSVIPEVGRLDRQLRALAQRVAGGLAEWVPRIHAPQGIVRITATAGSGKTQLALRLLRDARAKGRRAGHVCFNRPLADHMRELAPPGVEVSTFHQRCWDAAGRPAAPIDLEALANRYCVGPDDETEQDLLVIDEVQDLRVAWVEALVRRVSSKGDLFLLDDPAQCLYDDREEVDFPNAVVVMSMENFRSPRRVVEVMNALDLVGSWITACSPFEGELPGIRTWAADASPLPATAEAVQSCIKAGFLLEDVAVVTWRGLARTALKDDALGNWKVSRFTGDYDDLGRPVWTEGPLKVETLRRIKGQSSAAVVLTEIDFEAFGPAERRMLFVGMTRARMHLELVMSARAEVALTKALAGKGA